MKRSVVVVRRLDADRHETPCSRVIDLEGRVVDAVVVIEHVLEVASNRMAVVVGANKDVRREGWKARADRPQVEIVDADNSWSRGKRSTDVICVHSLRCRLK